MRTPPSSAKQRSVGVIIELYTHTYIRSRDVTYLLFGESEGGSVILISVPLSPFNFQHTIIMPSPSSQNTTFPSHPLSPPTWLVMNFWHTSPLILTVSVNLLLASSTSPTPSLRSSLRAYFPENLQKMYIPFPCCKNRQKISRQCTFHSRNANCICLTELFSKQRLELVSIWYFLPFINISNMETDFSLCVSPKATF